MTLLNTFGIASNGLNTQVSRLEIHAANISNMGTPNYVRKIPVIEENAHAPFDQVLSQMRHGNFFNTAMSVKPQGANYRGLVEDPTPARRSYQPYHPEADKDGFVTMSNTNILADMADAMISSKMYEANLAVISVTKAMANRAVDLGRGQ